MKARTPTTPRLPGRLPRSARPPPGHAHVLAVEVVDLPRFQAGTAVQLGPGIQLERQTWLAHDDPQLTQGRHQPMAKQQMTGQRDQGMMEQVRIADVEEYGAIITPITTSSIWS
jgi:hypothetical protein